MTSDRPGAENEVDAITRELGARPGKVVAVHLNYPSRAAQRGRVPTAASYFLKPSTALTGSGTVVRPEGTELLGFEAEIALVIGRRTRSVDPTEGWSHVGWVTAANDLGLYDLRAADRGSNARSKGADGFAPVGPRLLPAGELDPERLTIRAWLEGDLVQEDSTATLLFGFGLLVADLSRVMTLEVGDVILTGTPAGASVIAPGQTVEVEVVDEVGGASSGRLTTTVVPGPPLGPWGSAPAVDDRTRAEAWGADAPPTRPALTPATRDRLGAVAVATLSSQLRARGYPDQSIDGVHAVRAGSSVVGSARTLRLVPHRPDLFAAAGGGFNAQKRAVDGLGEGDVLVMEARGDIEAGTLGDILALCAERRGAAGIVTDGSTRDAAAVAAVPLAVFAGGAHPAVLGRRHVPWETDVTIACGGTTVQVGDIVVGDDDGVVVIPPALVDEVLAAAETQEREEAWIADRVAEGARLEGLYPLSGAWRARYEAETAPDLTP